MCVCVCVCVCTITQKRNRSRNMKFEYFAVYENNSAKFGIGHSIKVKVTFATIKTVRPCNSTLVQARKYK